MLSQALGGQPCALRPWSVFHCAKVITRVEQNAGVLRRRFSSTQATRRPVFGNTHYGTETPQNVAD
jgi:hypothetical protein